MSVSKGDKMNAQEVVRKLVEDSKLWSQNSLAKAMGLSSQAMSNRMNREDLKVGFFAKAVGVLGCKLVVLPPQADVPRGAIVIDPPAED